MLFRCLCLPDHSASRTGYTHAPGTHATGVNAHGVNADCSGLAGSSRVLPQV